MRILFVIHSLESMGGAEKVLVMLANYFSIKHEVSIVTLEGTSSIFDIDKNIYVYNHNYLYKEGNFYNKVKSIFKQVKYIRYSIKETQPDVVISFISAMNIIATIAAKISATPIIVSEHSSYHRGLKNKFWKTLRRIVYPFADSVVILTKEDKEKYHYCKDVNIIPNPLILKEISSNIPREKIILGVGRLNIVKGFDMLIQAFSEIKDNEWRLIIAGEGEERENLENLINKLEISHKVEMPGLVKGIERLYKKSAIYVLSSRSEGFPGGLCEAMGYGCACIAFDCPTGPKEIITDSTDGILVEANNVEHLVYNINLLIEDIEKREFLGKNAVKIVDILDIKSISKEWEAVMCRLLKRKEVIN